MELDIWVHESARWLILLYSCHESYKSNIFHHTCTRHCLQYEFRVAKGATEITEINTTTIQISSGNHVSKMCLWLFTLSINAIQNTLISMVYFTYVWGEEMNKKYLHKTSLFNKGLWRIKKDLSSLLLRLSWDFLSVDCLLWECFYL